MKKHLTTLFLFAATMMTAFTLTGCGEEVNIEGPDGPNEEGLTTFSSTMPDGTRTTMAANGMFYWQTKIENNVRINDQIWIDPTGTTGTSFSLESASSAFENNNRSGRFYFTTALGADIYNLSYTGFGSTTGDEVTIKEEQVQSDWNNSDHIGTSGDCATATATRETGTSNFNFTLQHKSSYLILQPYAPAATNENPYILTGIEIVDLDNNALSGTFPLTMAGLSTNGATNTAARVRLTCASVPGFFLPTAPSSDKTAYAVILPRGAAEGGRPKLEVRYHVHTVSDGDYLVVENISGRYEPNDFRVYQHNLSVPPFPTTVAYISDGNGLFGGVKFKPAFLRRTNGNATTGATLELDADPFILLQYNQGVHGVAPTEFQKRMWFTWNELAEIFGETTNSATWNTDITRTVTIGGKTYRLPASDEYSSLIETPNAGRATVNYYPASFAAVVVDLSGDATYSTKGWNRTSASDGNVNATHIAGYLFFPDESVILDSKILVASLNGRWGTTASTLTADELRNYISHGCMFFPAVGNANNSGWFNRGSIGYYWSNNFYSSSTATAYNFYSTNLALTQLGRTNYFAAVLVEN